MANTKAIVLLIVAAVLVVAVAGIVVFAQVSATQANSTDNPTPQTSGSYSHGMMNQGSNLNSQAQKGYSYGSRMGMCARLW
jgi:flagellar basal body-associated protein FliL